MVFPEYAGMNYKQASKEADRLIKGIGWFIALDELTELRSIMLREMEKPNWGMAAKDWK